MFACWNWWTPRRVDDAATLLEKDQTRSSIIVRSGVKCEYALFERAIRGYEEARKRDATSVVHHVVVTHQEDRYDVTVYEMSDASNEEMAAQAYQRDAIVFPFDATSQKSFDDLFTRFNFLQLMLRPGASFPDRIWIVGVLQTQEQKSRKSEYSELIEAFEGYLRNHGREDVSVYVEIVHLDDADALAKLIRRIVIHSLKISEPARDKLVLSPELRIAM